MRNRAAAIFALVTAVVPAIASAKAKVHQSGGRPLTTASSRSPAEVAAEFLRLTGRSGVTFDSLREAGEATGGAGLTHVRLAQEIDGLRVYGAYARATVNDRGELLHLIDGLVSVTGALTRATIDERQALRVALATLHPQAGEPGELSRDGRVVRYLAGSYSLPGNSALPRRE